MANLNLLDGKTRMEKKKFMKAEAAKKVLESDTGGMKKRSAAEVRTAMYGKEKEKK